MHYAGCTLYIVRRAHEPLRTLVWSGTTPGGALACAYLTCMPPHTQTRSRLIAAITAPQTPYWRAPAAGDSAVQPLTDTRRVALLGPGARACAPGRQAPSYDSEC